MPTTIRRPACRWCRSERIILGKCQTCLSEEVEGIENKNKTKESKEQIHCEVCNRYFIPRREWQKFCSKQCRMSAWKNKELQSLESICVYCGIIADTVDHIPPTIDRIKLIDLGLSHKYVFFEVKACKECNCALGARGLWRLHQRKRYIKRYLKLRYAKYLNIPNWTATELMDMSSTMRKHVIHGLAIKDLTIERLKY